MDELEFLKHKGLIKNDFNQFVIKGDFGEMELVTLLKEYKAELQSKKPKKKTIKPLHLNLHAKWFDMIQHDEKWVEYREISPFFCNIFLTYKGKKQSKSFWKSLLNSYKDNVVQSHDAIQCLINENIVGFREYSMIILSNGFRKDRRQMQFKFKPPKINGGISEWGATPNQFYFCLNLLINMN